MQYRPHWTKLSLLLGAAATTSLALTGCNGGSSASPASLTGNTSRAAVYLTDAFREDFAHVWATIYRVELIPQDGSAAVVVFEDTSGRQIDLKTLRDANGERYSFLNSASVPAGVYTGVNVTVGSTMQLMKNGTTVGDPLAVDSSIPQDTSGHPVLNMTFKSPKTLGASEKNNIVVDFNLARFIVRDSKVLPALNEGEGTGLPNAERHEKDDYRGTVSGLSGEAPMLTFTLNRGKGKTVTVTTTASTALYGDATLAEGAVVDVTGTMDPTTQEIVATQIEVRAAGTSGIEAAGNCTPRLSGEASQLDATAGSFTLTLDRAHGLQVQNNTVTVLTRDDTVFRGDSGATLTKEDFFAALVETPTVSVEGNYDSASNTLTATRLRTTDPAKDGGWARESHNFRENGIKGKGGSDSSSESSGNSKQAASQGLAQWGNGILR
jgi:hypothetical protein